jgi:cob(I)alamin adenosyltransferase
MNAMVHVYTGNGKGKTTAAFGLALRAVGAGKVVKIIQFIKSLEYSEVRAIKKYLPMVTIEQFGTGCFITKEITDEDRRQADLGLKRVKELLKKGGIDLLILDEINIAVYFGLIDASELVELLRLRKPDIEVVLTGRYAKEELILFADLVTEMKEVKHYYQNGIEARDGIER